MAAGPLECPEEGRGALHGLAQGGSKGLVTAAGDKDWEKRLQEMVWTTTDQSVNRKLGTILKGRRGRALDRVEIPSHNWFLPDSKEELYRYMEGVFEAFLDVGDDRFHIYHLLEVLLADTILVLVDMNPGRRIEWLRRGWSGTSRNPPGDYFEGCGEKSCVMDATRREDIMLPGINWFHVNQLRCRWKSHRMDGMLCVVRLGPHTLFGRK